MSGSGATALQDNLQKDINANATLLGKITARALYDSITGKNQVSDRPLGRGLAGLRVSSVDQHRAGGAEAGSAPELRAMQTKDVPEHPQQRSLRVPVVNLHSGAVDKKFHGPQDRRDPGEPSSPDVGDSRAYAASACTKVAGS